MQLQLLMTGRARGPQNPMDPPPELRTLCLGTESLKPTRWVNVRNWRFVLWVRGQRRNMIFLETCWYWRWHFLRWYFGDHIYIYIYVLGVIFFEITVYFLGDLFLGSFFHLSLGSTLPPNPVGFCQFDFSMHFFVWGLLKNCGIFLRKVG